jgi:hypothetical protein
LQSSTREVLHRSDLLLSFGRKEGEWRRNAGRSDRRTAKARQSTCWRMRRAQPRRRRSETA